MILLDVAREYLAPLRGRLAHDAVLHANVPPPQARAMFGDCVMRPMLPQRYGIANGIAFSQDAGQPPLEGLLVFDALHHLPLGRQYPVELVYALLEVSAYLDAADFELRLRAIEQFKRLRREKSSAYDVSPIHHLRMFGARYAQLSDDQLNPALGYVFADESHAPELVYEQLNAALKNDQLRAEHSPDAIFGLKGGWMIARQTRTGELAVPRSSFSKFGLYRPGSDLVVWAYFLLNAALSQVQLRAPDLLRPLVGLTKH